MKDDPEKNENCAPQILWKGIIAWFRPSYDETTLFLIALTSTLLLFTYQESGNFLGFVFAPSSVPNTYHSKNDPRVAFFLLLIIAGIGYLLSFLHVFIRGEKGIVEKSAMATFAMLVNGATGIAVGVEMLSESISGILLMLPAINILSGIALLYQVGLRPEETIRDEDATLQDVLTSSLILLVIFVICRFFFQLSWAVTFSACLMYATLLHNSSKTIQFLLKNR